MAQIEGQDPIVDVSSRLQPASSPIRTVPTEIMLSITSNLPPHSHIALSLTCRSFWQILRPLPTALGRVDLKKLRLLLERDIPDLMYCHFCNGLVRWGGNRHQCVHNDRDEYLLPTRLAGFDELRYQDARLVMNCHFYGPLHGPPIEILNRKQTAGSTLMVEADRNAKIVGDELFLHKHYKLWHRSGSRSDLRRAIDNSHFEICPHIRLNTNAGPSQRFERRRNHLLNLPQLYISPSFELTELTDSPGSCQDCLTDYTVSIGGPHRTDRSWCIDVHVYQQLGPCRSPEDWKWSILSAEDIACTPYRRFLCRAGAVRHLWNFGAIIPERLDGSYVLNGDARFIFGSSHSVRICPSRWPRYCEESIRCSRGDEPETLNELIPRGRSWTCWWGLILILLNPLDAQAAGVINWN